ncbi:hypothetical protein RS84_00464 [Microbacterium hydrocarbonoxydans]|uniref:Ig-like domain-containing protein n=1 Tax=Microbacterium hydrocarbonoxydans TaxID=273678 RepID=A0A0M2HQ78_9MICO|nr:hypothetical protein [Microbacterium hydrocarbonoxydans]KJL48836.1 hypothetical protein RS84_00464 [Microbacterium hydrocarbonoxydans]
MNRRQWIGGLAGLALLVGLGVAPPVQQTQAAWVDSEYGSGAFTAGTLVTPVISSCTVQNNGLGIFQSVTLVWTAPYPLTGQKLTATSGTNTGTVTSGITVTGPSSGTYTYTAVLSQALLTSLVTNLLGSTTTLTVTSIAGTAWTSPTATRKLTIGLAGLGATCVA